MAYSKKNTNTEKKEKKLSIYTIKLNEDQMDKLKQWCDQRMWDCYDVAYARFAFRSKNDKVNLVAYESGKLVIQGKGTEEFVSHVLELEVTGEPRLGYEEFYHPEWFEPHAGLDEAGKGDLFGPLVSCCVIADGDMVRDWIKKGLKDSKKMTDNKAIQLERQIRRTKGVVIQYAFCGMPKYNQLMNKPAANLNKLLAWMHARSLEGALKKKRVPWGLLDQFSKKPLVNDYFKDQSFELKMRVRAEDDPVVAAASVCARVEFLRQMKKLSDIFGDNLLKGAGAKVKEQAKKVLDSVGRERFGEFVKLHFKTAYEVQGLRPPQKAKWVKYSGKKKNESSD